MIYLILDTNTWIYLANGYHNLSQKYQEEFHFRLLNELIERESKISVLINEIIIEEWVRNKATTEVLINKYSQKIEDNQKHIKKISKHLNRADVKRLKRIHKHFRRRLEKLIEKNRLHIQKVEDFLTHKASRIPITPKVKNFVTDFSIKKKAPFHNSKNNMADALILFSTDEFVRLNVKDPSSEVIFISNNVSEFCNPNDHTKFHDDILQALSTRIHFETNLGKALNLSKSLIEDYEKIIEEIAETNEFECMAINCITSESFSGFGHLDSKIAATQIVSEENPYQLKINLGLPEQHTSVPTRTKILSGECHFCGTTHFLCPVCDELICLEQNEDEIECECLTKIYIKYFPDNYSIKAIEFI